ncbi:Tannase/feruloyl esterase [Paraphoma chrysanthemicola]|uniref:Carboxylic ester hydrolase n=1 Tax=Paraphoma chrysanthemicola TaxID=798071 RepID=A0A8K0RCK8_9PLEO|nr:Tannase/feruloyl esterase [Paraphoma chrysanthemicola]
MRAPGTALVSFLALLSFTSVIAAYSCDANTLPTLELFGASILSINAVQVSNSPLSNPPTSFCNVTITYTHPGQNDTINTGIWLPNEWNGRFQGVGGGGWVAGLIPQQVILAVAKGYAAVSTDGGHDATATTASWGLVSPGNINWYQLQDFSATALNDMTVLGKQVTEAYYGKSITKSYWNGCSQGGRQGLMMAQRYPDAYDGILAIAPAINWAEFIPTMFWPQRVMKEAGYFPSQCELNALIAANVAACDELDGLKDGVVGLFGQCAFDPKSVVGQPYSCSDGNGTITAQGAAIIQEIWSGAHFSDGKFQWYQITPQSPLNGVGNTTCSADGTCTGVPSIFPLDWHRVFLQQNASFDPYTYTDAEWDAAYRLSVNKFTSVIGTSDPDLTGFKQNNGKMITWHGTSDQLIPFNNTVEYYQRVLKLDPSAADYYRIFTAPGAWHCAGGLGPQPTDPLAQLVSWVEGGVAPATLKANRTVAGENWEQELCQWPLSSIYKGGDPKSASSFACE